MSTWPKGGHDILWNLIFFQSQTALSFIRMVRHDIDVQGVKKILEKVIAKKVPQELADLDLGESLDKAKKLIEGNALKGNVKDWSHFALVGIKADIQLVLQPLKKLQKEIRILCLISLK